MSDGAASQEATDAYVFTAATVQGKSVSQVCIRRGRDSIRFRTGAFRGDLGRVRETILAVRGPRAALDEVVKVLKRSLATADPELAVSKKARGSIGRTFANFWTGLPPGFLQRGYAALKPLSARLTARLLAMHEHYLPNQQRGEPVHARGGSRALGCVTPTAPGQKHFYTENRSRRGTFKPSADQLVDIRALCEHLASCTGRDWARMMPWVDFMLSFPGQTPQQWHQDGESSLLGFVVVLTAGRAPEFAPYVGSNYRSMRTHEQREEFLRSAWKAAQGCPEGGESTLGPLQAGGCVATHTAHIHRQPPPPASGLVYVFSELRLAETGLHVFPDIQDGKLIGKYLKHADTGLIIPLDLASGIVVVKTDPKFDARHLDMNDGAELAELSAQIDELRVDHKTVNNIKKANKRNVDGDGEEFVKKAKLQSCCKELVFKQHNSSESLIDSNHTQSSSLIESDHTKKSSTVSYCVSNHYFRE